MAVYKNKYNLWSVQGKFKDGNGKFTNYHRYKGKNGFKLKKDAVEADLKLRRELSEFGRCVPAHQFTFKDLCNDYFTEKKRVLKYSTIYADVKILKRATMLDDLLLKDIMPKTIQKILDDMDEEGLSLNYIGRFTDTLNKIFKYAREKDYMSRNPLDKVTRIKRPNAIKKKNINYWEPHEFKEYIQNVSDPLYHAYFVFAYYMGCRRGEMLALQWKDIDFKKKTISCGESISFRSGTATVAPSARASRLVVLPA